MRKPDRTLIIGYGNPLRSDDGFGWHAGRLLAQQLVGKSAKVITCHQLTPELAETLSQYPRAVFIDADVEGVPGQIHRRAVRRESSVSPSFTHTCSPSGLLASAQTLYGQSPRAVIFTVSAGSFELGEKLSPVVTASLRKVVDQVCHWIQSRPQTHHKRLCRVI